MLSQWVNALARWVELESSWKYPWEHSCGVEPGTGLGAGLRVGLELEPEPEPGIGAEQEVETGLAEVGSGQLSWASPSSLVESLALRFS